MKVYLTPWNLRVFILICSNCTSSRPWWNSFKARPRWWANGEYLILCVRDIAIQYGGMHMWRNGNGDKQMADRWPESIRGASRFQYLTRGSDRLLRKWRSTISFSFRFNLKSNADIVYLAYPRFNIFVVQRTHITKQSNSKQYNSFGSDVIEIGSWFNCPSNCV